MKTLLFGIAVILFALVLTMTPAHFPFLSSLMGKDDLAFFAGTAGLVIAGIGAFREEK